MRFIALPFCSNFFNYLRSNSDKDGILCDQESQSSSLSLSNYRYLFILGQILHGFGAAPLITLGTTFLDDSVSVRSSSVYIGIFQTFFLIGPAIGFVLGGQLLSLHTDFITDSGLTSYSSLWVGAWWPGFLLSAAWALICGLCILCYPSNINKKKKSPTSDTNIEVDADKKNMFKTLSDEFLSLMKNATYGLLCVAVAIDAIIVSGMASFLPKYFEQQYGMTTGSAGQSCNEVSSKILEGLCKGSIIEGEGCLILDPWFFNSQDSCL